MMTPDDLDNIYQTLLARGYTPEQASAYSIAIGDTPEHENGLLIIRDPSGFIIDRIPPLE